MTYLELFLLGLGIGAIGCENWLFISEIALPRFQLWRARRWRYRQVQKRRKRKELEKKDG